MATIVYFNQAANISNTLRDIRFNIEPTATYAIMPPDRPCKHPVLVKGSKLEGKLDEMRSKGHIGFKLSRE